MKSPALTPRAVGTRLGRLRSRVLVTVTAGAVAAGCSRSPDPSHTINEPVGSPPPLPGNPPPPPPMNPPPPPPPPPPAVVDSGVAPTREPPLPESTMLPVPTMNPPAPNRINPPRNPPGPLRDEPRPERPREQR